jgi:hypothetical protein
VTASPLQEPELTRWFAQYSAEFQELPGSIVARLYAANKGLTGYVALFELADGDLIHNEPYPSTLCSYAEEAARLFESSVANRYERVVSFGSAVPSPGSAAQLVRLETDPENEAELVDWYSREHLPDLSNVPGTYRARLFRAVEGTPKYLATYEMSSIDIMQSDDWHRASATPWTKRIQTLCTTLSGVSATLVRTLP